ncbi:MAG: hypothetical protein ACHQM7_00180 [Vicinamibacterales bacterium]|jgi:hypothetical protein
MPRARRLLIVSLSLATPAVEADTRASAIVIRPLEAGDVKTVEAARQGAQARLRAPECRKLLADFSDAEGRPLEQRLAAFALPPEEFLATLPLLDGSSRPLCQGNRSHLLTTAGVPRVFVCKSFLKAVYQERVMAEVYLIHELLHTLGLGENPPTSHDITRQVVRRCAP